MTKSPNSLQNKKILIGLCGSIALQKIPILAKKLSDKGAKVSFIFTKSAKKLLDDEQINALKKISSKRIYSHLFEKENPMRHIELSRKTDLFIIAPLSAQSLSKLASGQASDLLSATALASNQKVWLYPAMNHQMYENFEVQKNIEKIKQNPAFRFFQADIGQLACGEYGIGRLIDIDVLVLQIENFFKEKILANKKVLMSVGAGVEMIDPVRFISNFSSGKMGFAIADYLLSLGAEVAIIQAKVETKAPKGAKIISALSAQSMLKACQNEIKKLAQKKQVFDYFIGCAAVCDYRVKKIAKEKIKKTNSNFFADGSIQWIKNPDIIQTISQLKQYRPKTVIGFAAETENLAFAAEQKLHKKNLDFVVANWVGKNKAFNQDENEVLLLQRKEQIIEKNMIKQADKRIVAQKIVDLIIR